ncbi:MAG: hypothetical protein HXS43_12005 [Theionarchaea archaeon]|nr:hypothetical protein [Theionarchaea archaeon]
MYTDPGELSILGVTAADLNLDEADYSLLLSRVVSTAQSMIDSHCGQSFIQTSVIEKYDGDGHTLLFLDHSPILSVTQVLLDGEDIATDCITYKTYISYLVGFTPGSQNVTVSYTYGYSEIPELIQNASFEICKRLLHRFKAEKTAQGMTSERLDDYQYSLDTSDILTDDIRLMLAPFAKKGGIV